MWTWSEDNPFVALRNASGDVWRVGFATSAIYLKPNNRAVRGDRGDGGYSEPEPSAAASARAPHGGSSSEPSARAPRNRGRGRRGGRR